MEPIVLSEYPKSWGEKVFGEHLTLPLELSARDAFSQMECFIGLQCESGAQSLVFVGIGWSLGQREERPAICCVRDHICLWDHADYTTRSQDGSVEFLDLGCPYDPGLIAEAKRCAGEVSLSFEEVAVTSHPAPWLLSPAERKLLDAAGAQYVTRSLPLAAKVDRALSVPVLGLQLPARHDSGQMILHSAEEVVTFMNELLGRFQEG